MKTDLHALYPRFPFALPFVLDGATGTNMHRAGMPAGACPEKWILSHPRALVELQKKYFRAGSAAVISPTFGANSAVLSRYGITDKKEIFDINTALCRLSREAAGEGGLVAGGMSPTGRFLRPFGDASFDEIFGIFREQALALEPHCDFFELETNISLSELRAAIAAVKSVSVKPIFATVTLEGGRTMSGDTLPACLAACAAMGVSAFGANCSTGPEAMLKMLSSPELLEMSEKFGIPLIAKPNAGCPGCAPETPESFFALSRDFLGAGIFILGGCCGTDESHIVSLKAACDGFEPDFSPAICKPGEEICLSNSRSVIFVSPEELELTPVIAEEDFEDDALDAAEDGAKFVCALIENPGNAEKIAEAAAMLPCPTVARAKGDAAELFKRFYIGSTYTF